MPVRTRGALRQSHQLHSSLANPSTIDIDPKMLDSSSPNGSIADFPHPSFTTYRHDARHRQLPQCIAHRGYRAIYPENSMIAFEGAVRAGAHALETDVHITKDDVVVLSHDLTLNRCFGRPDRIIDRTWDELKGLRTTAEPHVPMPRLLDLLEYLSQPGLEEIWVLLDIKLDNEADDIMRLIGSTLSSAPSTGRPWSERIVLGLWSTMHLPLAAKYAPGFPVSFIGFPMSYIGTSLPYVGFSLSYARQFFKSPNVSFNLVFHKLIAPGGKRFLRDARSRHRPVYSWTVNAEDRMQWCIRNGLDGVITDDPRLFNEVCERFDEDAKAPFFSMSSLKDYIEVFRVWAWLVVGAWFAWTRLSRVAGKKMPEAAKQ